MDNQIADALIKIADAIKANPAPIIGQQFTLTANGPGQVVTGMSISMTDLRGNSAPMIGNKVVITDGPQNQIEARLIEELMEAAAQARKGAAAKSWLRSLAERALALGIATLAGPIKDLLQLLA